MRLTLWYVTVLALIVIAFALGVYMFLRASLLQQIDNHVERDLETVTQVVKQGPEELEFLKRHGNVRLFRVEEAGGSTIETDNWRGAGLENSAGTTRTAWATPVDPDQPYRIKTTRIERPGGSVQVSVAHDGLAYEQNMDSLTITLLIGMMAALTLAIAGGYFLAGRALSPIGAMAAKAREITAEHLSERLPVGNPDDEFGQLALAFNETFLRLEDSFERMRRFTAVAVSARWACSSATTSTPAAK
jgi:HAMP domain-containing protein